ncbi:Ribosomal protein L11 methyltransferase [Melia azedarach]|uniref:Ribosomal protein L11 methyltransferase n=1 Tax=Melia azedarach TaxID=155640 RepID=A0ACC1YRG4_MELAZ|nr:Ribosomal protein L11 methyltransferase [Melia azedarach]
MSFGHFFKHLPYALSLSRSLTRPLYTSPLTLLSALSFTNYKPKSNSTNVSALFSSSYASPSSADTSSTECSGPAYLSVRIRCRKNVTDMFSEALLCFGASSTSMDEDDALQNADEIYIDSIFPECEDVLECISNAANSIGLKEIPHYEVKTGEQWDWIKKTQESFHPVEVTKGLWIVPEWSTPPDVQATNIILNPGLAFGSGEHPTTKLCLLLLRSLIKGGELFLDYGTGSGVLGIAAIKFGAALSVGVDIDPLAISSACHNAALNNIGPEKMKLYLVSDETFPSMDKRLDGVVEDQSSYQIGVISKLEKYDVVIANILLNPLLELADDIVLYAKPGAVVGISGILSEQLPQIINQYSQFLEDISVSEMDDWACVSGIKKTNLAGS